MAEGGRYPGRWSLISGYFGKRHSYHGDPTRREALAIFLNGVSGLQHYSPAISPECDSLTSLGSRAIR